MILRRPQLRESLKHLRHTFVQILFILRGLVGQRVFGTSARDQLFSFGVVQVDYWRSYFVVLLSCCRVAEPSAHESSPSPAPTIRPLVTDLDRDLEVLGL